MLKILSVMMAVVLLCTGLQPLWRRNWLLARI